MWSISTEERTEERINRIDYSSFEALKAYLKVERKIKILSNGILGASQVALVEKNLHASAGDIRNLGSIPWLGRSPGGGNGNPLQYSCLYNPMDRGAWQAAIHRVANNQTRLKF